MTRRTSSQRQRCIDVSLLFCVLVATAAPGFAQAKKSEAELVFPPTLPGDQTVVTNQSDDFLKPPVTIKADVAIAKTPPTVDFLFYPGQDYPGKPWSNWGDSLATGGKYYSAIGDHLAIGAKTSGDHETGTAFVFEYDPATKSLRQLADVAKALKLPAGHYTPGKIHSRLDMGSDGWLYYATHRGSIRSTTDEFHYQGDWILRTDPATGSTEVVVRGPVPHHAIPNGLLDPDRLIYYGGTAAAFDRNDEGIQFFAYDVKQHKLLYAGPDGPARYMIFAKSTGRAYYVPGSEDGPLVRFDPTTDKAPIKLDGTMIGVRAATAETPQGFVYTVSRGQGTNDATVWSFNTQTETTRQIGSVSVGSQAYVGSVSVDPSGRYLYYVPGAHGGSERDGTAIVQFDVTSGHKKVIAFLEPYYTKKYGFTLKGTYGTAIDPTGDKLYVTWNVSRGSRAWDCCGMTVIHIPESERN